MKRCRSIRFRSSSILGFRGGFHKVTRTFCASDAERCRRGNRPRALACLHGEAKAEMGEAGAMTEG